MTIVIISLVISFTLVTGFILFSYFKGKKKKNVNKRLEAIRKELDNNVIRRNHAEIQRIEKIVNVNPKYQKEFDEMLSKHISIELEAKKIETKIQQIAMNIKVASKKELDTLLEKIFKMPYEARRNSLPLSIYLEKFILKEF